MPQAILRCLHMDDVVWRRHANPWSVWTRLPLAPLLVAVIFARTWLWNLVLGWRRCSCCLDMAKPTGLSAAHAVGCLEHTRRAG